MTAMRTIRPRNIEHHRVAPATVLSNQAPSKPPPPAALVLIRLWLEHRKKGEFREAEKTLDLLRSLAERPGMKWLWEA